MDYDVGIVKRRRIISPDECYFAVPAPGPYVGPGDLASGWLAWYGMRAFSAASIPANAVRLLYNDAVHQVTYTTRSDGTIDLTAAGSSNGASHAANLVSFGSPATVSIWYDQTGNGNNLAPSGVGTKPVFTLNSITTYPGIVFDGTSMALTGGSISQAQPFGMSIVAMQTASVVQSIFLTDNSSNPAIYYVNGPDRWVLQGINGGSFEIHAEALSVFHAVNATNNSTSSHLYIDGVDTATGAALTTTAWSGAIWVAANSTGSTLPITGTFMEAGVQAGGLVSAASSLNSNQHNVYGF